MPVVFDNFIWFSDDEIAQAVSRALPTFDGTMPETEGAITTITNVLDRLLRDRNLPGHVDHIPTMDVSGANRKERFKVAGAPLTVCAFHFPGASAIPEGELAKSVRELVGAEYSREEFSKATVNIIAPLYRQRGYFRARLSRPSVEAASSSVCPAGVVVSLSVEEGRVYKWDHAEWSGNAVVATKDLDAALK